MSFLKLSGVVFDVDGVLFDTEVLSQRSWEEIGQEMGWPQARALHDACTGRNRAAIVQYLSEQLGPDFPAAEFMVRTSQRTQDIIEANGVPLKPGIWEILEFLKFQNIPIALATSSRTERTSRRLELTGLGPYFQAVVTGDDVAHSKPHPEIYQTACAKLGIDPKEGLAVEDSPNGIRSAYAAGMQVVMVPDLLPSTPELDAMLFKRVSSLLELRDYLKTIL